MKKTNIFTSFILCSFALFFGIVLGFGGLTYYLLPHHEELNITEADVYYSLNGTPNSEQEPVDVEDAELSIHFLELGNKYTGDATYIKAGEIDILIDCGSKSSSIPTVSNYINQFVTDGILEYVIVTHAHQDHYAGFATIPTVQSIFDIYECKTIIDFALTNQKSQRYGTSTRRTMYDNYLNELDAEISNGATHYKASDFSWDINDTSKPYHIIYLNDENTISLEIMKNYYYFNTAPSENDYSVCIMLNHNDKKFLFTGDLENEGSNKGEQLLTQYYKEQHGYSSDTTIEIDLYKAGHHGSKTSSSLDLLNFFQPKKVCVCCCAGSSEYTKIPNNQFPTQEFIDNISQFTDAVYVTSLCINYKEDEYTSFNGNIVVLSTGNQNIAVSCSNNNLKLKDTEWFKNNRTAENWSTQ